MGQFYLGSTELNQTWLGNTQINQNYGPSLLPKNGLIAYYIPGEDGGYSGDTVFDLSGNGNNLTLSGTYTYSGGVVSVSGSSSGMVSDSPYTQLTGSDPEFTIVLFINAPQRLSYDNLWYLGNPTLTADQGIWDDNINFNTFDANKIIFGNGFTSGPNKSYYTLYDGNGVEDYVSYSRTDYSMLSVSRTVSSSYSGSELNGKVYIKNYRYDGLDTTGSLVTSAVSYAAASSSLNPYVLEGGGAAARPITTNWSTVNPKLYIGVNPSDPTYDVTYNSAPINFAGAFIYNRVLANEEIEGIYAYVNGITLLT
jgi:hypothetical protein